MRPTVEEQLHGTCRILESVVAPCVADPFARTILDNLVANLRILGPAKRRFRGAYQILLQLGIGVNSVRSPALRLDHAQRTQRQRLGRVAGRVVDHAIAACLRNSGKQIHPLAWKQHRLFDRADIGARQSVKRNLPQLQRRPTAMLPDPLLLVEPLTARRSGASVSSR